MKAGLIVAVAMLVVLTISAASATSLNCSVNTVGSLTTYTYTFTSTEAGDYVTSLHLYSLLNPSLIKANTAPTNWLFGSDVDPDPEVGLDMYWYADNPDTHGIGNGSVKQFSLTVPSWTTKDTTHVVPGCFGNWGYECQSWPGAVIVAFPSVAVPKGVAAPAVPELSSLLVLVLGLAGFAGKLRRAAD